MKNEIVENKREVNAAKEKSAKKTEMTELMKAHLDMVSGGTHYSSWGSQN